MKTPTPILMFCIGGQRTSVLARTFYLGGMVLGNEKTLWKKEYLDPHCEHSLVTELNGRMGASYDKETNDKAEVELRKLYETHMEEAKANSWEFFGIKTTAGICADKWDKTYPLISSCFENPLFISLLRKPHPKDPDFGGWKNVLRARMNLADNNGGMFFPFPEIFLSGEIEDIVKRIGLEWHPVSMSLFDMYKEEPREMFDAESQEQFEYLVNKTYKNFNERFPEVR